MRRNLGGILLVLGILGFTLGGMTISRPREIGRMGPLRVTVQENRTRLVPLWLSGALLLLGAGLVVTSRRRGPLPPPSDAALPQPAAQGHQPTDGARAADATEARLDGPAAGPER